eukprot:scaffold30130_cov46-Isochrysis_galbana.AAC.1
MRPAAARRLCSVASPPGIAPPSAPRPNAVGSPRGRCAGLASSAEIASGSGALGGLRTMRRRLSHRSAPKLRGGGGE